VELLKKIQKGGDQNSYEEEEGRRRDALLILLSMEKKDGIISAGKETRELINNWGEDQSICGREFGVGDKESWRIFGREQQRG